METMKIKKKIFSENLLRLKSWPWMAGYRGQHQGSEAGRQEEEGEGCPHCAPVWGVLGDARPRLVSQSPLFYLETRDRFSSFPRTKLNNELKGTWRQQRRIHFM